MTIMANGTLDFVKHKFDILIVVLAMSLCMFLAYVGLRFHDDRIVVVSVTNFGGLVGALINMATNRNSTAERASDPLPGASVSSSETVTKRTDVAVPPKVEAPKAE